jgi:hypothetical protein
MATKFKVASSQDGENNVEGCSQDGGSAGVPACLVLGLPGYFQLEIEGTIFCSARRQIESQAGRNHTTINLWDHRRNSLDSGVTTCRSVQA